MKITVEQLEAIQAKLRALPELGPAKRNHTKQEAVRKMVRLIQATREKGYTIRDIAEQFRDSGIPFTEATLNNCLSRARKEREPKKIASQPAIRETHPPPQPARRTPPSASGIRPDTEDL